MRVFIDKRWIPSLLACALCLTTLTLGRGPERVKPARQSGGSLAGRVVDQSTGMPIAKASVSLSRYRRPGDMSPPEPTAIREAQAKWGLGGGGDIPAWVLYMNPGFLATLETGPDGSFRFTDLTAGDYLLDVAADRYLPQAYGEHVPGGRGRVLPVKAGEPVSGADFQVLRAGTIAGTVAGSDGEPLPGASVVPYRRRSNDILNVYLDVESTRGAIADAQGRYRLEGLKPGDYYVAVLPPGTSGLRAGRVDAVSSAAGDVYVRTYYPGTSDGEAATRVKVAAADVGGIDFTLRPAKTVVVSGTVRLPGEVGNSQSPGPAIQAGVALVPMGLRIGPIQAITVSTGPEGSFQFNEVFAGKYQIVAAMKEGGRNLTALREIAIQDGNLPSLVLDLQRGFDVPGHVVSNGAPAGFRPDQVLISIFPRELFPPNLGGIWINSSSRFNVDASGDFVLRDVMPGVRYDIGFTPDPARTSYLSAARYGDRDVYREPAVFEKGERTFETVLSFQLPRLEVLAVDQGKPGAGVTVIVAPKNKRWSGAYLFAIADAQGKAVFSEFALALVGDFDLFAIEDAQKDSWLAAGFWEPFEGQGVPIHIDAGGVAKANVQVIKVERGLK